MLSRNKKILGLVKRCFSSNVVKQSTDKTPIIRENLQFSKAKLTDFGEIQTGEVPDALTYDFKLSNSRLENGLRIATEQANSNLATVTVMVQAGTRNECLETSGVSQFIKSLILKGTATKSKEQLANDLLLLGGNFNCEVSRETTCFQITTLKENAKQAVLFLNEVLSNSLFDKAQIEAEREAIENLSKTSHQDQMQVTMESVHYTSYRDHMMGQPTLGIRENIANISQDQIKEFVQNNYTTHNSVVTVSGNVDHNEIVDACKGLKLNENSPNQKNTEKAFFTPSTLFMRDDEMVNANFGVFFNAPTYKDPEFFAMHFLLALQGEYRCDQYTGAHLNHPSRQYNSMHEHLGDMPDVSIHKTQYLPYSDTALLGSYLHGNEVFAQQMMFLSQFVLTEYSQNIAEHEMFRSRNEIFNKLLNNSDSQELSKEIANQLLYLNRRIPRSEFAKRISSIEKGYLQRVVLDKFFDTDISMVAWGPLHQVVAFSHYNRPIKRSTLGSFGNAQLYVF